VTHMTLHRSTAHADAGRRSAPHNFRLYITRFSRKTKYERDDLDIERVGFDLLRTREGPVAANELTVPTHERRWRDEEGAPTLARKKSCECREHGAISGENRGRATWRRSRAS